MIRLRLSFAALAAGFALAAQGAPTPLEIKVDAAAVAVLQATGVPSASIAVIRDDHIALVRAYGHARLDTEMGATPAMRYAIGSVSKEFLAATVMLLVEQHKMSLDDPVAKYFPKLTEAAHVRVRDLLGHTSGYRDFWPQDYVPEVMLQPIATDALIRDWATLPLDFPPGTQFQYSNTGYSIAGAIVEKITGAPLMTTMRERIFEPLGMHSVLDVNLGKLGPQDPTGYMRYALGPLRAAPKEGPGWLFAAGGLAMTAEDLARWDLALLDGKLLSPASLAAMSTTRVLANGASADYGLGLFVSMVSGRRVIEHDGEVSGFVSQNTMYPDDKAAIVVLTNQDASAAAAQIRERISKLLFLSDSPDAARQLARAQKIFTDLQQGKLDRALFTPNGNAYWNDQALSDAQLGLAPLGTPQSFEQTIEHDRGGMRMRRFEIKFAHRKLVLVARELPDGRFEQYQLRPE
jgi:CubicO group peptidase (beta-lactamase class C family)